MTFDEPFATWFPDAVFDGSYGRTEEQLRAVRPMSAPDGFAARWRGWRSEARRVDAAPRVLSTSLVQGRRVSVIEHSGADGVRLRAWTVEPLRVPARIGVVHGHGYGGRDAVDLSRVPDDAAAIFPVARGLGALNAGVGAPEPRDEHVLAGIDDPERTVIGLCARDLWLAADALQARAGALPLYLVGESFGGGIGALALPWDGRYVGATLIVPSFGQYDERLAVECLGSGEAVRRHVIAHPEARETLRWFDASTSLQWAQVPVRVEAALWDQNVPPQGQFAIAAAVAAAKASGRWGAELELAVLPAGHADYPGMESVTSAAVAAGLAHLERAASAASHRG